MQHHSYNPRMQVEPRPPIAPPPVTPALRFLYRGEQLQRLQQYVIASMLTHVERERDEFHALELTDSASAMKIAAKAMSTVASANERISDVQLMLQLFFCRHVDNFQTFLEETLRAIYTTQPSLLKRAEQTTVAQVLTYPTME